MRFTDYTDYSLRVLMYLHMKNGKLATVKEVSTYYSISHNHLVKVVHNLGQLGYIHSEKGKGGGIRLGLPAEEINVGEVIKKVEPNFNLVACFDHQKPQCMVEPMCALKGVLSEAMDSFLNIVSQYSLADAVKVNDKETFL